VREKTDIECDWRFMGQDKYLKGINLICSHFSGSIRKHAHCEFCFCKFSDNKNDLHQGYYSLDKYYWIRRSALMILNTNLNGNVQMIKNMELPINQK